MPLPLRLIIAICALAVLTAACTAPDAGDTGAGPAPTATEQLPAETSAASTQAPATTTGPEEIETAGADGVDSAVQPCADVIDAEIEPLGDGTYRVDATVRSGDTGWDKYADAWEVRTPEGEVLGVRVLAHPHETEQPFTRSLAPVEIGPQVEEVLIAARDSVNGFCGKTVTIPVP